MADIAAQPFINYGQSQAQQAQEQSAAAVNTQQAQATSMQNQVMQARLPFIMRAYEQMSAQSDASGVSGAGQPGGPLAAKADAQDKYAFNADQISGRNRTSYFVPDWTPDEQKNMQAAAISGDPSVTAYYTQQRQQRLDVMHQKAAYAASNAYDKYAAVANAPDPETAIQQADPAFYRYLQKYKQQNPDADTAQLARGYAQYQAADLHKYTGRGVDYKNDIAVDKENGLPVAGVPQLPMSRKDQADLTMKAQEPSIKYQTGKGNESQMTPWQVAGYRNVHEYLSAVAQGIAPDPDTLNKLTAGRTLSVSDLAQLRNDWKQKAVQTASQNGTAPPVNTTRRVANPANPGALEPVPPRAKPVAQPAAQQEQPGSVPANQQTPQAAPQPATQPGGGAPSGLLTDPRSLPRTQAPQNPPGQTLTPQQQTNVKSTEDKRYSELNDASTQQKQNSVERNLIAQSRSEIARLQNDPRSVGPGSKITTAWNELRTYAAGQSPDALVDRKMLDKVLLQMGAANVRAALSGQKITNAEFMKLLNEGNPSTQMPLQALSRLVDFAAYNNEYDTKYQNTRIAAMRGGADPYSQEYADLGQGRTEYVQGKMYPQGAPPASGPDVTQEQHAKLKNGEKYWWKGTQYTKGERQ